MISAIFINGVVVLLINVFVVVIVVVVVYLVLLVVFVVVFIAIIVRNRNSYCCCRCLSCPLGFSVVVFVAIFVRNRNCNCYLLSLFLLSKFDAPRMFGFTLTSIGRLLVLSHLHSWKIFAFYCHYSRFIGDLQKKRKKKKNSRSWGWMIIAECKGMFLLFYLARISCKVACTSMHMINNIHRTWRSGKSSWH